MSTIPCLAYKCHTLCVFICACNPALTLTLNTVDPPQHRKIGAWPAVGYLLVGDVLGANKAIHHRRVKLLPSRNLRGKEGGDLSCYSS